MVLLTRCFHPCVAFPLFQFPLVLLRMSRLLRTDSRFKFLFDGYTSQLCWWESVVLLRKFLLSCVRILVTSPSVQGQLGVLILFGCAMVQSL